LTAWELRARDKNEDLKVLKTFEFSTGTSNPVFSFRGRESSGPRGVVARVKNGLSVARRDGGEYFVDRKRGRGNGDGKW
jgi:hypothetical protein